MKIAIIGLGRIGDLVLLTSIIKPLKKRFPNCKIYFIVGSSNHFVLANNPDVEDVLIFDKNPLKLIPFLLKLKKNKFDYYIDIKDHYSTESNIIAQLANAKIKIGFNDKNRNSPTFDIGIASKSENLELHFVERIANILQQIDINNLNNNSIEKMRPSLYIDRAEQKFIDNFLHSNNISNFILVNISASDNSRMWQIEKWIELVNYIKKDKMVIISSAPIHSDTVNEICKTTISPDTSVIHFPPSKLMLISALILRADLLISPDTSVIHIASAFDIPVISLTSNIRDNIIKFYPLSSNSEVIFPKNENETVEKIEVETVLHKLKNF